LQASAKTLLTSSALYLAEGGVRREKELVKPITLTAEQSRAEQSRAEQVKLCPFVLFKKDIKTLLGHG